MRIFPFITSIVLAECAGVFGALFTPHAIAVWFTTLARPALAPPNWVFAPVWTALYLVMGIAAYIVWRKGWNDRDVRRALYLYAVQLALNMSWPFIFFGMQNISGALICILILWLAIAATALAFRRVSRPAAYLLLPYLAWVTFATYLNAGFWMLN